MGATMPGATMDVRSAAILNSLLAFALLRAGYPEGYMISDVGLSYLTAGAPKLSCV
jgi:hypothetical protein